jgi:hypothetical protein
MKCQIKKAWINIEREHTSSEATAKRIVKEHINEWGCGYYPALKKMELKLKRK